jgi:hypothetical protein
MRRSQLSKAAAQRNRFTTDSLRFGALTDTLGPSVKSWLREFWLLCKQEKKWWLIPLIVLVLLGLAAVFILASNSGISWALYPSK